MKIQQSLITHSTPSRNLLIDKFVYCIDIKQVKYDPLRFKMLCKKNCRNYGVKYSCPPLSPSFDKLANTKDELTVICYRLAIDQYTPLHVFHSIRASNSVLKSIIDHELLSFKKEGYIVVGSGSCRACKNCGAKTGEPCRKPDRRLYSLEALGVNVDLLVKEYLGFNLQWYIPGEKHPDYTCVVGAVLK